MDLAVILDESISSFIASEAHYPHSLLESTSHEFREIPGTSSLKRSWHPGQSYSAEVCRTWSRALRGLGRVIARDGPSRNHFAELGGENSTHDVLGLIEVNRSTFRVRPSQAVNASRLTASGGSTSCCTQGATEGKEVLASRVEGVHSRRCRRLGGYSVRVGAPRLNPAFERLSLPNAHITGFRSASAIL